MYICATYQIFEKMIFAKVSFSLALLFTERCLDRVGLSDFCNAAFSRCVWSEQSGDARVRLKNDAS